jgi:hypothetical protein
MFGSATQIQFSVFESNFLRDPLLIFLFGSCVLYFEPNSFTVLMILKSAKMRTRKRCFHFWFSVLNIII